MLFLLHDALKRKANILQSMVDCRDVNDGTVAWDMTHEALQIAHATCEECGRNVRGYHNVRG